MGMGGRINRQGGYQQSPYSGGFGSYQPPMYGGGGYSFSPSKGGGFGGYNPYQQTPTPEPFSQIAQFDPSQLQGRLTELEGREIPQFDPTALQSQIEANQASIGNIPSYDDSQLREEMNTRFSGFSNFNPSQLQEQIGGLQTQIGEIPQFDDSQLRADINTRFGNIPQFDPSNLQEQISGLQTQIEEIPRQVQFDPRNLQGRLTELETREIPQFDPSQLQSRLGKIENFQRSSPDIPKYGFNEVPRSSDTRVTPERLPTFLDPRRVAEGLLSPVELPPIQQPAFGPDFVRSNRIRELVQPKPYDLGNDLPRIRFPQENPQYLENETVNTFLPPVDDNPFRGQGGLAPNSGGFLTPVPSPVQPAPRRRSLQESLQKEQRGIGTLPSNYPPYR